MTSRMHRQEVIAGLLRDAAVANQEHLGTLLESRGIHATQATLSRDLRELGAVKTPSGYELPGSVSGGLKSSGMSDVIGAFITSIEQGGQMVVLKTGPGRAQLVAVELDAQTPTGVMGTVAGDDTIFLACVDEIAAGAVADKLAATVGLRTGQKSELEASLGGAS